jgi:glycine cleavage system H protein
MAAMNIPKDLKYTKTHEWVRVEEDVAVVGITDHAQHELTDIVYVEVPVVGAQVEPAGECAVVESVKSASDIYSPVSGEVVAANEELGSAPELLNQDPYGKGWMFKVRMSNPGELGELLGSDDYSHHIGA